MHRRVEWLLIEGNLVQVVAQNAQREDRNGQEVTSSVGATEDACQDVAAVLCDDRLLAEWTQVPFVILGNRGRRTSAGSDTFQRIPVSPVEIGLKFSLRPTYFQKIGLKAIEAAATVEGQLQSHAKCGERTRADERLKLNLHARDLGEKSTKSVKLAMAQKPLVRERRRCTGNKEGRSRGFWASWLIHHVA